MVTGSGELVQLGVWIFIKTWLSMSVLHKRLRFSQVAARVHALKGQELIAIVSSPNFAHLLYIFFTVYSVRSEFRSTNCSAATYSSLPRSCLLA